MSLGFGCTPIEADAMLQLIESQLRDGGTPTNSIPGGGLGSDAFLSLWPDQLHLKNPRSKRFVAIRPQRFPIWQSVVQGAGDNWQGAYTGAVGFNLVASFVAFVQITGGDPEMRSRNTLTEDTLNVVAFAMKVLSAYQMWTPKDSDGNMLLREPARCLDGGLQIKSVNVGEAWWAQASLDFEFKFSLKLPGP